MSEDKRRYYFGNYSNSADYNDNVPIGWNKWDAEDAYETNLEEDIELENESEAEIN